MQVRLRQVVASDGPTLLAWRNAPDVRAVMYTDHVITPAEHDAWFARALVDSSRRYWVIEAEGAGVGLANLYDIDTAAGSATWAYYLADASVRGKGIGAMAEYLVVEQAFAVLGLARLDCEVLETNAAVIKLHKRFGFVEEARLTARAVKAGQPVDAIALRLTAEGWGATRAAMAQRLAAMGFET